MLELSFRVKLSEVTASQLNCPTRTPSALPFFRMDFDGKMIQSPLCEAAGDPTWNHRSAFEYRLAEPDVEAAVASLSQRSVTLAVYFVERSGANEALVGTCTADLYTLATGAAAFSMDLHRPDSHLSVGRVSFLLSMEQQSVVTVSFPTLTVSGLPQPTTAMLKYHFISDPSHTQQSGVSQPSVDPQWTNVPRILIRSTLRGLLDNTLRVFVCDVAIGETAMAHCDIPFNEFLTSNATHTVKVSRNAYAETNYTPNFTALVTATMTFADVPIFAQFATGSNTNGSVFGKPLLDCLPLPPRFTKRGAAARLPAHHAPPSSGTRLETPLSPQRQEEQQQSTLNVTRHNNSHVPGATSGRPMNTPFHSPSRDAGGRGGLVDHSHSHEQPPQRLGNNQTTFQSIHQLPAQTSYANNASYIPHEQHQHSTYDQRTRSPMPGRSPHVSDVHPRSPMASMSQMLSRQHDEAQMNIRRQQQQIEMMIEELDERTSREEMATAQMLQRLTSEEARAADELASIERQLRELRIAEETLDIEHIETIKDINAQKAGLEIEMQELVEVESQLLALQKSIAQHADDQLRAKEKARREAEEARRTVENDGRMFGQLEQRLANRPVSPYRTRPSSPVHAPSAVGQSGFPNASYARPKSPLEGHSRLDGHDGSHYSQHQSRYDMRTTSPQKQRLSTPPEQQTSMSSSYVGLPAYSQLGANRTPQQSTLVVGGRGSSSRLATACKEGDVVEFHRIMREAPQAIYGDHTLLHQACAGFSPTVDIVAAILQHRPELLNTVDNNTGNTALHFACGAENPSLAVVEMLLARGCNPYSFNKEGLSPFHISLLNPSDSPKAELRKHFLFKVGVDINLPTTTGETPAHLLAVSDKHLPAMRFLRDHGGQLDHVAQVLNGDNKPTLMTPLQKAKMYGSAAMKTADYLESL